MKLARLAVTFVRNWAWHVCTIIALITLYLVAPKQMPLFLYKSALVMLGGCGGYWLFVAFFGRYPESGTDTDRWQAAILMGFGMLCMSMAA